MLRFVCFAAVVACAFSQHQLYPGDPGYQAGYQGGAPSYQQGAQSYQGAPAYQGAQSYQGAPAYQGGQGYQQQQQQQQGQPITATNYRLDDGQQRSESRDNEGNVKGQYSYVDPNGKTITVKYTAGKDGFQVEGDHLPRSVPVSAPAQNSGPASQGQYNSYQQAQNRAPHQFPASAPAQPQYRPQPQQYQAQPQYNPQQQQQSSLSGFPQTQSHRFGTADSAPGVSLNVDPAGGAGYNYQFNY